LAIPKSVYGFDGDLSTSKALIQSRNYVGGFLTCVLVDTMGDFNGTEIISDPSVANELNLVPGINAGLGFGGMFGHREGAYAIEASYWQSQHSAYYGTGTAYAGTGTANYQSIDINLKAYLFTEQDIQPFFNVGIAFPWVTFPEASTDGLGNVSTFSVSGVGLDAGVGIEIYLDHSFSIFAGGFERWSKFNTATGFQKVNETVKLEGDGPEFYMGGTVGVW
jgi:hypothetical protein